MFEPGTLIVYGNTGVCRVAAVGHPAQLPELPQDKTYYTLDPLYESGLIYAPLDTPVLMRPILTHAQADELIDSIPDIQTDDCDGCDPKQLSGRYRLFFTSCRCEDLLALIKTLYARSRASIRRGRRPGLVDQRFLKQAQALLHGELAAALGISVEAVPDYIASRIEHPTGRALA